MMYKSDLRKGISIGMTLDHQLVVVQLKKVTIDKFN